MSSVKYQLMSLMIDEVAHEIVGIAKETGVSVDALKVKQASKIALDAAISDMKLNQVEAALLFLGLAVSASQVLYETIEQAIQRIEKKKDAPSTTPEEFPSN